MPSPPYHPRPHIRAHGIYDLPYRFPMDALARTDSIRIFFLTNHSRLQHFMTPAKSLSDSILFMRLRDSLQQCLPTD